MLKTEIRLIEFQGKRYDSAMFRRVCRIKSPHGDLKGMRVAKLSKMHLLEHLAQALAGNGQTCPDAG